MKALLAIGMLALVAPLAAGETRLGTGVNLKDSTAIKALVEQPAAYVGKTLRVDGVATAVCTPWGAGWPWPPRATKKAPRSGSRSRTA